MDIIRKARKIEGGIARTLGSAARSLVKSGPREPIEVTHAIVDAVEKYVQLGGRGRRVFPFNTIVVSVFAPTRETRTRYDAVLVNDPGLQSRIVERLRRAGCAAEPITVNVEYVARAGKDWTDPEFGVALTKETARPTAAPAPAAPAPPPVEIVVVRGAATAPIYTFTMRRICFGRGTEVRDNRNRLVRSNDVAFADGADEINASVSRQHAHVDYEADSGAHRLHDDGSVHGTGIVRDGRTIIVPRGGNGVRLRAGDEIVLGDVRVRFEIPADND